jgi:polar amino acid transport system permease protein
MTVIVAVLALVLSLPLGVLLGICQVSPYRTIRYPVSAFVGLVRATPLLLIIFWIYFLLPIFIDEAPGKFQTILISLAVFEAVYISIIIRAGIQSLPKGQMESARALGFSYLSTMILVVMPQVMRNMLPSLIGEFVAIIKLTSLGYVVGLSEVTFVAEQINSQVITKPAEVYALLGVTYFLMCFGISRFSYWLERRLSVRSGFAGNI